MVTSSFVEPLQRFLPHPPGRPADKCNDAHSFEARSTARLVALRLPSRVAPGARQERRRPVVILIVGLQDLSA